MLDEIEARAADGESLAAVAREVGMNRSSLRRLAVRHGVKFTPRGSRWTFSPRRMVEDMRPIEAVDFLVDLLETMQGYPDNIGRFPGDPLCESERVVFSVLYHGLGRNVPRARVYDILYAGRAPSDLPDPKGLDVRVCNIRDKLAGVGAFSISTVHGFGWRLDAEPGYRFPWERAEHDIS